MSQIEQNFRQFLSKKPEIEACYQEGLINRRSLGRYLTKHGVAKTNELEAVVAMLRRFPFQETHPVSKNLFSRTKITIKDKITILDFQKEKDLVLKLPQLIGSTNYDRGDTFKVVVGSASVKVFLDEDHEKKAKAIIESYKLKSRLNNISEISIVFPEEAIKEQGVLSTIVKELTINGIVVSELLTASPELLIYLKEEYVLKAYDILKRLQRS